MVARAYLRVSTREQQEQGESLRTQRAVIRTYADSHALTVEWYEDVLSGTRDDRPEYQRLLSEMQSGDTILVWRLDRIGRKKSELFRLFDYCKQHHIALVSVTQPELTNELVRDIMSVLAAYESQQIAERVLPNLTRLVEGGKWVSRIPHWYEIAPDGHLTPTADAWQAQECWEMFLRTGNKNQTAAAYGLGRRQLWWMLNSPTYVGAIPWMGSVHEGAHPAIVRRETWEATRALLTARRHGKRRERAANALLTGFIFVEDSQRRMHHHPMRSKNFAYRYYATGHDHYYHEPRHVVRAEIAEGAVLDALRSLTLTPAQRREVEREMRTRARQDGHKPERAEIARRIGALESEQVRTARMMARGELTAATWETMRREQAREMTALIERQRALPPLPDPRAAAPVLDLRLRLREDIDEAVRTGNIAALRMLMEALIVRVEIYGAESPRLHGGAARRYWMEHVPRVRVVWVDAVILHGEGKN